MSSAPQFSDDLTQKASGTSVQQAPERARLATSANGQSKTSQDAFWGGRIVLRQPRQGFRAGTASVLLAAFLPSQIQGRSLERLVDLGAGVGTLGLLAAARLPSLQVRGFEIMGEIANLAQANANDLSLADRVQVHNLDIFEVGALTQALTEGLTLGPVEGPVEALAGEKAQAVICNPPFTDKDQGRRAQQAYRASAHQRAQSLEDWMAAAKTVLSAGGWSFWVLPAASLQTALQAAARTDFGAVKIMPVQSFARRPARLVLLALRKNRRGDSQILPPFVLYDAPGQHSAAAKAVLQDGRGIWEVFQMPFAA